MNASIRQATLAWMIAIAMLLSGCGVAPQIDFLQPIASMKGMYAAVSGTWDTYRYMREGEVVLVWWQKNSGWGMSVMNQMVKDPMGAWNYLSGGKAYFVQGFADIDAMLISNGWKMVEPQKLNPEFVKAVSTGYSALMAYLSSLALNWCTIIVVPAGEMPGYGGGVQN